MKLLKLKINSEYKNLKGVYDFSSQDGYVALIGLNGSGKSNLLEAISLIFNGIFDKKGIPFDYEIEYKINEIKYYRAKRVAKKNGVKVKDGNMQYPSSVIACYSGEELRLWHKAYEDYHMHYFKKAIDNDFFAPRLLYVNKYCWAIALIALLADDNNEYIKTLLKISDFNDVTVTFEVNNENLDSFKKHDAYKWFSQIILDNDNKYTVYLNQIITHEIFSNISILKQQPRSRTIFQFLYLLSQPKKNDINKVDKLITAIDIKIGNVSLEDLSEGEKKIILIECITKVLADENSLILLDEPDAHVHISRKNELLKIIDEFKGQTVFTTHSPVLLNLDNAKADNIFYINNGKLEDKNKLEQIRTLSGGMIDYFEGIMLLNSKKLLIVEGPYDKRYLKKAINALAKSNPKYIKLNDIAIFYTGGTGEVELIYNDFLKEHIDNYDKIVFLYDYDGGGFDGWNKTKKITNKKVSSIFYQEKYDEEKSPSKKNDINFKDTVLVEDFFSSESYKTVKDKIDSEFKEKITHKDYRKGNKANGADRIKGYIEKNYLSFEDKWYEGFTNVLDKLLEFFFK
jgi:ABC-type cobalamin/Fe3+-siderophores transport system ATPase subunit